MRTPIPYRDILADYGVPRTLTAGDWTRDEVRALIRYITARHGHVHRYAY